MRPSPILLATRSEGKLRELGVLFARAGIAVENLSTAGIVALPEEDGVEAYDTFEANALAKARYFFDRTGRAVVADDSGLEVNALGGAPGVRSKRWSGRDDLGGQALDDANNAKLLLALADTRDRRAQYVCVAAYVDGERTIVERGEAAGRIVPEPRGAEGFGYDPYFESDDLHATFAEVSLEAKERVSHRGRAFGKLVARL